MNKQIGRNDPCHCGSGKKYKKCHLALDQQRKSSPKSAPDEPNSETPVPAAPAKLPELLQQLRRTAPRGKQGEIDQLVAQTQPLLTYLERREEIEAATAALEAHREEFERLVDNQEAYLARTRALFDEEPFAALRFTPEEVRRALDKVGCSPSKAIPDEVFVETLRAAILSLADKDRRSKLSMNLLLLLPQYLAAGRHLDGWIIQHCAYSTIETAEESNPFLFQMFSHGYEAWVNERTERDEAMLREIGLDPARARSMSMAEIDAWLQAQEADPDKKSRMEAIMAANPDQRAAAVADLERMERDSIKLLEREDARDLLLTQAELESALPNLLRRFETIQKTSPDLFSGPKPDEAASKALAEIVWPAFGEMAGSIFTPERIQQLIAQLKRYRDERFASGDKVAAGLTLGAIASLQPEDDPTRNYFLNALCLASFRAGTTATASPK